MDIDASKALALRILGSRSLSSREIEKRLVAKGQSADAAQETVKWLMEIGAVDDKEYADSIVRHYTMKGYGLARIKQELFKRGIEREMWEEALECIEGMADAAYDFAKKRLASSSDKDDIRRMTQTLQRRGYSYEEAREAIKK